MAGVCHKKKISAHNTIESADNIYKISSLETIIADNNDGNSNQLILLNTSVSASDKTNCSEYKCAYRLPQYRDSDDEESAINHEWKNDEITDDVLNNSKKLELTNMDLESQNGVHQYGFSYNYSEHGPRYI